MITTCGWSQSVTESIMFHDDILLCKILQEIFQHVFMLACDIDNMTFGECIRITSSWTFHGHNCISKYVFYNMFFFFLFFQGKIKSISLNIITKLIWNTKIKSLCFPQNWSRLAKMKFYFTLISYPTGAVFGECQLICEAGHDKRSLREYSAWS